MPVSNVRRPQRLQRERAQVRDDLLLGELTISLERFAGEAVRIAEPCPQIFSDGGLARLDQRAVVGRSHQPDKFAFGVFARTANRDVNGFSAGACAWRIELEPPAGAADGLEKIP